MPNPRKPGGANRAAPVLFLRQDAETEGALRMLAALADATVPDVARAAIVGRAREIDPAATAAAIEAVIAERKRRGPAPAPRPRRRRRAA